MTKSDNLVNILDLFGENKLEMKQYEALDIPKLEIAKSIRKELEDQNLSLRKVAALIDQLGFDEYKVSYTQIARVTQAENYKIDTLLKVLDVLGLEIRIQPRK